MNSLFYDKAGVPTSEQLTTYSDRLIFDTVNSTIYTKQKIFGNRVETSAKTSGSFPLTFLDRSNGLAFTYTNSSAVFNMTLSELQVPNLWLKTSSNYGSKLSFGNKDFAYIKETTDNILTVYSSGTIFHSTTNPFYFNNKKVVASAGFEGNLSGFATSSGVSNQLSVNDYRDSVAHGPSYYTTKRVTASFENNGGPTSGWNSFLSIYGWQGSSYKVWQIGSNADNNTTNQNLYFRTSNSITNNTWHPWKRVITDKDTEVYVNSLYGRPNYTYLLGIQTNLAGANDHVNIYGVDCDCPFAYLYSTTGDNDGSHYLWATQMRSNLFRGELSGNASSATTAKVTVTATNANYPLILGPSTTAGGTIGTGNKSFYIDNENNLYYNPFSNTLTATNFAGTATNATNANNIEVDATSTNATYYLTFVNGTNGNRKTYVNSSISVNPSTDTINTNISGNANTATTSTNTTNIYLNNSNINSTYYLSVANTTTSGIKRLYTISTLEINPYAGSLIPASDKGGSIGSTSRRFATGSFDIIDANIVKTSQSEIIKNKRYYKPTNSNRVTRIAEITINKHWCDDRVEIPVSTRWSESTLYFDVHFYNFETTGYTLQYVSCKYKGNLTNNNGSKNVFYYTYYGNKISLWHYTDRTDNYIQLGTINYNYNDVAIDLSDYGFSTLSEFTSAYSGAIKCSPENIQIDNNSTTNNGFCYSIKVVSQTQYNNIQPKDPNTLYLIV